MNNDIRREASIPVQSRIDIRTLAEICRYFRISDINIKSASQLVSWSLEMLLQTLKINDKLPNERPTIEDAYGYLGREGLMQKRMLYGKVSKGLAFESIRMEGENPAEKASHSHKMVHNNPNWTGGGEIPDITVSAEAQRKAREFLENYEKEQDILRLKESQKNLKSQMASMPFTIDSNGQKVYQSTGPCKNNPNEEDKARADEKTAKNEKEAAEKKQREKDSRERKKALDKLEKDAADLKEKMKELRNEETMDKSENDDAPATRSYEEILKDRIEKDARKERELQEGLDEHPGVENIVG